MSSRRANSPNNINYPQNTTTMHALCFHALLFTPSLIMVAFGQSSMAAGLVLYLTGLCIYMVAIPSRTRSSSGSTLRGAIFTTTLLASIFFHAVRPMIIDTNFQFGRFIYSYLTLSVMCISAFLFTPRLIYAPSKDVSHWVNQAILFLVFNAILGLCDFKIFPNTTHKPVGVFSEPSHFALVLAPLLTFICATKAKNYRLALAFFFAWGLAIENLTTIMAVIISSLITIRFAISKKTFITIIAIIFFAGTSAKLINTDYFTSRLEISSESNNLSALVLLQGWESAAEMFSTTEAWGSGFQQFGSSDVSGEISQKIATLTEYTLNKFDGGSTAAKIAGEFGLFGLIVIIITVALAFQSFLRLQSLKSNNYSNGQILLLACLFTYIIELFARGVGYFSPTGFLALCALISYFCYEKNPSIEWQSDTKI